MEGCRDLIQCLGQDLSLRILLSLDDPSDLIRCSAVSTSWRSFVVANGLSKKFCMKKFPELLDSAHVMKENYTKLVGLDHEVYGYLAQGLTSSTMNSCISNAMNASSTGNYPEESVQNTVEPREHVGNRASYWSSTGHLDPTVPEKIFYRLISNVCLVTEIHVQPFQGCCQNGSHVYSCKALRFRLGHPKFPMEIENNGDYKFEGSHKYSDGSFVWSYVSPEFPMAQENRLQKFKLPQPVLCVGGIFELELLGRAQRQETDGLYYIRITHVQVVGRPLRPGFGAEIIDGLGRCKLNYRPRIKERFVF